MGGQVFEFDARTDPAMVVEHPGPELIEAKAAAALPTHIFGDAALLAIDDLGQAWLTVRAGVIAHLDTDPAAVHLVGDSGGGAGAEKGVEDEIAFVGGDMEDALDQALGLRGFEHFLAEQRNGFLLCLIVCSDISSKPQGIGGQTRLGLGQEFFSRGALPPLAPNQTRPSEIFSSITGQL